MWCPSLANDHLLSVVLTVHRGQTSDVQRLSYAAKRRPAFDVLLPAGGGSDAVIPSCRASCGLKRGFQLSCWLGNEMSSYVRTIATSLCASYGWGMKCTAPVRGIGALTQT